MKALSLGEIGKLAGYSRARIHSFAIEGKIPGKPVRRPPEGQYRYENTPKLRAWCRKLRKNKPKAQPRNPSPRSASGRTWVAVDDMLSALESGTASRRDLQNAIQLLQSAELLVFAPLSGSLQPCTKGVLTTLSDRLLGSSRFDASRFQETVNLLDNLRKQLYAAEKARTSSEATGEIANHCSA
jgi:hypothetical protein